jgi:hypothetical protein
LSWLGTARCRHPPQVRGGPLRVGLGVSTRRLILAALLCGLAILVAFAIQVALVL